MVSSPRARVGVRRAVALAAVPLALLSAPTPGRGQAPPSPAVVIRAGTLIDGVGGTPMRNAIIVIEGERITAVGPAVGIPRGARVIDLSGMTVLPGFIDAHTHLTGPVIGEPGWDNAAVRETIADAALRGAEHARQTLEGGFTTVRNVGADGFADVALRNAINAGRVTGPRMVVAGHAIGITGGHCDENGFVPGLFGHESGVAEGIANGADDLRRSIRYQVKYGADVIKLCATGGVLSEGDSAGVQQLSDDELRVAVETAHLLERRVAAHAHGTAGIKAAVRAGVSSIEHGSMLDDEAIQLMVQRGTYLVPTLMAGEATERMAQEGRLTGLRAQKALAIAPHMRDSFRRAAIAGVKVALGTDAGVMPHGHNGHEFTLMVRFGMTPAQAIQAGTRNAAELLGREAQVGTIQAGRFADIVAVVGDPLVNIQLLEDVAFVMKGGVVVKQRP